jgi:hypothetical protein
VSCKIKTYANTPPGSPRVSRHPPDVQNHNPNVGVKAEPEDEETEEEEKNQFIIKTEELNISDDSLAGDLPICKPIVLFLCV